MSRLASAIASQPAVLRSVLELELEPSVSALERARTIWLVGTGTSQHAAELGARLFAAGGLDARWASSASFVHDLPTLSHVDAVVVISHTGDTAFAAAARQRALEVQAGLVTITGDGSGWSEAVAVAPRERSETYTVSYTAVLMLLARFAQALGGHPGGEDLEAVVSRVETALADPPLGELRPPARLLTMIGAGYAAVTAREGALKCREAAQLISEGFEADRFLHGQAVPFGPDDLLLLVAPSLDPDGLVDALGQTAAEVGSSVASIDESPGIHPFLAQIPLTVGLQLLASSLADQCGSNPDQVIVGPWARDDLWNRNLPRPG